MSASAETSAPPQSVQTDSQQQQQSVQQNAQAAPATPTIAGDSLTCQWSNCGERCATAEQLYDHVCERHVGRKSTNNLNLTCQWGSCRTTTVKRDHITSHIRVHVPLKPHKCDFCGKAFKRPQDLKKHVKTHADDSVLLRSPEPNRAQHGGGAYGQPGSGKFVADLQALAATATGYYPNDGIGPNAGPYHQNPGAQAAAAFYGNAPPSSAYGNVYYAVNQQGLNSDYEIRKRAAYDALNEFFGDAKRRIIDPATYYDVGARLAGLQGIQLPVVAGGYGGVPDYHGGAGTVVSPAHAAPPHQYSLPLPNLRTKSDLVNIDQFLDQLQTTVYENSNHAAAAGVAQAGTHILHSGIGFRSSNSPPGVHGQAHQPSASHATAATPLSAPTTETPALTPASSVLSYTSGQSPNSVHSSHTISPTSRASAGSMYPTLPSVTAMSDMPSNYPATSSAAPSALAPYNQDSRRRLSEHLLQKSAPDHDQRSNDPMDTSDDQASTPRDHGSRRSSGAPEVQRLSIQSPGAALDPSLRSPSQHSASSSDHNMSESMQESWVENIRIIERLRGFIKEKLERGDFDDSPEEESAAREPNSDEHNLYPILRAVRDEE